MPFPHIAEILKLICDNLISEQPTLASLARTCTSFNEPALDVLWSELRGFYPLTKCLPTQIETEENMQWVKLTRPLTSEDRARFQYFSRKVHKYTSVTANSHKPNVSSALYLELHAAIFGEKLLPNIRQLNWDCLRESYTLIPMLLGNRLSTIRLTVSPNSNGELSLVSALLQHYTSLTDVTIVFSSGASPERKWIAVEVLSKTSFTHWTSLTTLALPNINHSGLVKISRLACLETLKISDLRLNTPDTGLSETPKDGFPKLNFLHLVHCLKASDCVAILKLMDHSPLRFLVTVFWQKENSDSWRQVFCAINQHCDHTKLEQLTCVEAVTPAAGIHEIRTIPRSDMLTYEDLKPILAFRKLRYVEIEACNGFYFDDPVMIGEMATSWRYIEELGFRILPFSRTALDGVSKITPSDLGPLAIHCPRLKLLTLPLDATSPPQITANYPWPGKIPKTNISILSIGDSPVSKPDLVGANLSAIFPSLRHIKTIEHEEALVLNTAESITRRNKAWKKAETQMRFATRIRIQERRRARAYNANDNTQSADEEYGVESSDDDDDMEE